MSILSELLHPGNVIQARRVLAAVDIEPIKSIFIIRRSRDHAIPRIPSSLRLGAYRDMIFSNSLEISEVRDDTESGGASKTDGYGVIQILVGVISGSNGKHNVGMIKRTFGPYHLTLSIRNLDRVIIV